MSGDLIVLKFGGSVLRDELHVRAVAEEVAGCVRRGSRVVAVVSALEGTTDALLAKAAAYSSSPNPFATAQLLATGELASAALLGLALDSIGVRAETLDAAGAGFRTEGEPLDSSPVAVDLPGVVDALGRVRAVVVPGFVGRDERGRTTVLGRGGSDLTALFLAQRLGASCRLVKDVDGLYEWDPSLPGARPRRYATLPWDEALALDGTIVQHKAVRWAREHKLAFEVGSLGATEVSRVGEFEPTFSAEGDVCSEPIHAA